LHRQWHSPTKERKDAAQALGQDSLGQDSTEANNSWVQDSWVQDETAEAFRSPATLEKSAGVRWKKG